MSYDLYANSVIEPDTPAALRLIDKRWSISLKMILRHYGIKPGDYCKISFWDDGFFVEPLDIHCALCGDLIRPSDAHIVYRRRLICNDCLTEVKETQNNAE